METRSTFDLNNAILTWKHQMSTQCALSVDVILELESHLLHEIDFLKSVTLTNEEAFLIAKKRIGSIEELKDEFAKVHPNRPFAMRIRPYLTGIIAYLAFLSCAQLISYSTILCAKFQMIQIADWKYLHPIILLICGLILVGGIYYYYSRGSKLMQYLNSLPLLIGTLVISKCMSFGLFMYSPSTQIFPPGGTSSIELYGISEFNYSLFQISVILFIITISILTYRFTTKSKTYKFQ